jgi:hypothetical protein
MFSKKIGKDIKLAFEFGHNWSVINIFINAVTDDPENVEKVRPLVDEKLADFMIYYSYFFSKELNNIPHFNDIKQLKDSFKKTDQKLSLMFHVNFMGKIESAFRLGALLGINDWGPPQGKLIDEFKGKIIELLCDFKIKLDKISLENLILKDSDKRQDAIKTIQKQILGKDFKKFQDIKIKFKLGIPGVVSAEIERQI